MNVKKEGILLEKREFEFENAGVLNPAIIIFNYIKGIFIFKIDRFSLFKHLGKKPLLSIKSSYQFFYVFKSIHSGYTVLHQLSLLKSTNYSLQFPQ